MVETAAAGCCTIRPGDVRVQCRARLHRRCRRLWRWRACCLRINRPAPTAGFDCLCVAHGVGGELCRGQLGRKGVTREVHGSNWFLRMAGLLQDRAAVLQGLGGVT